MSKNKKKKNKVFKFTLAAMYKDLEESNVLDLTHIEEAITKFDKGYIVRSPLGASYTRFALYRDYKALLDKALETEASLMCDSKYPIAGKTFSDEVDGVIMIRKVRAITRKNGKITIDLRD